MNRKPFLSAATAPETPGSFGRLAVVYYKNVLYTNRVAGSHNSGFIVRVKYIFQHDCEVVLSLA